MATTGFPIAEIRSQFPALDLIVDGRPVYLDGPGGTQVAQSVLDAMIRYLTESNANRGGQFRTSRTTDGSLLQARRRMAEFFGTQDPGEIVFGPNMTSLTWLFARALAKTWSPGDRIVLTHMEHDANFTPWAKVAEESGVEVAICDLREDDLTLDLVHLHSLLDARTKLVAVGYASNAVGTVHPVSTICELAHEVGSKVYVDAVHFSPHDLIDVVRLGCDFLVVSAYKFFGPHVGVLWGRRNLLESLEVDKLRVAPNSAPDRWMIGTQNHAAIVGAAAAVGYLEGIGQRMTGEANLSGRSALVAGLQAIRLHEQRIGDRLLDGIRRNDRLRLWGIRSDDRWDERVPTFAITHRDLSPQELADRLGQEGFFVWNGNFYALPLSERLGLEPDGLLRIGLVHYNTLEEVDRLLEALDRLG